MHHTLSLLLSVPGRQTVKQTKRLLSLLVRGHFMLELAALLSEGAGSIMNPLVTIDLLTAASAIDGGVGACERDRARGSVRSGSDDVVDVVLLLVRILSVYLEQHACRE